MARGACIINRYQVWPWHMLSPNNVGVNKKFQLEFEVITIFRCRQRFHWVRSAAMSTLSKANLWWKWLSSEVSVEIYHPGTISPLKEHPHQDQQEDIDWGTEMLFRPTVCGTRCLWWHYFWFERLSLNGFVVSDGDFKPCPARKPI